VDTSGQTPGRAEVSSAAEFADFAEEDGEPAQDGQEAVEPEIMTARAGRETGAGRASDTPQSTVATASAAAPAAVRATPVEGAAQAQMLAEPHIEAENSSRLVESMRVQWRQGISEAKVRLNPEHLGEVTISIRVDRGTVTAVVRAESAAVQQWLESQEERLRGGMADQGLNLEKFIVQRDQQQQQRRESRQPSARRYRQPTENSPRFEVIV
jgi:flagellar hook-length control protein FliK